MKSLRRELNLVYSPNFNHQSLQTEDRIQPQLDNSNRHILQTPDKKTSMIVESPIILNNCLIVDSYEKNKVIQQVNLTLDLESSTNNMDIENDTTRTSFDDRCLFIANESDTDVFQQIETFFDDDDDDDDDDEETKYKAKLPTFEKWFDYADKNSKKTWKGALWEAQSSESDYQRL